MMNEMRSHFERLNAVGEKTISVYVSALVVLAISSAAAAVLASFVFGSAANALPPIALQVLLALSSSLTAAALVALAVIRAMQRLLTVYIALALYGPSSKSLEAKPAFPAREEGATVAVQPMPRTAKPAAEQSVASAQRATTAQRAAVGEKKTCPYCHRVLPFGDVHIVCPYCGRRLK